MEEPELIGCLALFDEGGEQHEGDILWFEEAELVLSEGASSISEDRAEVFDQLVFFEGAPHFEAWVFGVLCDVLFEDVELLEWGGRKGAAKQHHAGGGGKDRDEELAPFKRQFLDVWIPHPFLVEEFKTCRGIDLHASFVHLKVIERAELIGVTEEGEVQQSDELFFR